MPPCPSDLCPRELLSCSAFSFFLFFFRIGLGLNLGLSGMK